MKKITLSTMFSLLLAISVSGQTDVSKRLKDFDGYMEKLLKDWNTPGVGVGIVANGKLVFAKGYGYRDYGKKLPVTPNTLFPIASNTKLFTAVGCGMLVEEGKLEWDKPIRSFEPTIKFYNDELNNTVTLRDMLAHRTGISRHDLIWYKSKFNREELFDRLQYLEPSQPIRQSFLYNNLLYSAAGHIIFLKTGETWEDFTRKRIFGPLQMTHTVFSAGEMMKQQDYGVPYNENRDSDVLEQIPFYSDTDGVGPCGSIISNITDLSHWLITLMDNGKYNGQQVIPANILKETLTPAIPESNASYEAKGYSEVQNPQYGMGRDILIYRGHQLTWHGGALPGFYSQIAYMPAEGIGVIMFAIGSQSVPLTRVIPFNVFERLLGISQTDWSGRFLKERRAGKKAGTEARSKAALGKIEGTKPSHNPEDYTGDFGNEAYGTISISLKDGAYQLTRDNISMPLTHYHYDRFDTPYDPDDGIFSLNYITDPQGEISRFEVALDEATVTFTKRAGAALSNPEILSLYTGKYKMPNGILLEIVLKTDELVVQFPGSPAMSLIPKKERIFSLKEFPDTTVEFLMEGGKTVSIKQKDPTGEYVVPKFEVE